MQSTILPLLRLEVEVQDKVIPELTDEDWIEHDMFILGCLPGITGNFRVTGETFDHSKHWTLG